MAWNLAAADLPQEAKDYLSLLGGCGDEQQAASDAGVSEADIGKWSRLDAFIDHRRQALAHFEGWKDWEPAARASRYTTETDPYATDPAHAYAPPGGLPE